VRRLVPGAWLGARRVLDEPRHRQRDHDHQPAEDLQRGAPAVRARQRRRDQWHERAADSNPEVGEAHRLAAILVEPSREQHLVRQRATADIAQRVQQVADVKEPQRRNGAETHQCAAGHHDAGQHESPRPEPIDDPAGAEAEHWPHEQLAQGVAGRHFGARPAEIADEEVVEERQPVQRDADD
jgi:hypothetical protein